MSFNLLLSANTAADWVGGIFGIILLVSLIGFIVKIYYYDKTSIDEKLEENPESIFKFISSAGTLCEAITLSLISIENGNTIFESFTRYSLMGLFEIVTSFWFMSMITNGITKLVKDNNYNITTFLLLIIKSIPFFLFSFMITALIHFLYLESINIVEAQQLYVGFFTSLFGLIFESNPEYFSTVDATNIKRISIGAIIMIYSTTLVNIMLAIQQFKKNSKHFKFSFKSNTKETNKEINKEINKENVPITLVNKNENNDSLAYKPETISQSTATEQKNIKTPILIAAENPVNNKTHFISTTDNLQKNLFISTPVNNITGNIENEKNNIINN